MNEKEYSLATLEMICGGESSSIKVTLPWHKLREGGVFLSRRTNKGIDNPAHREVIRWHPRGDYELPALRIPFSARELAAFTLAGGGVFLLERFEQDDVLDEQTLKPLYVDARNAAEAVKEAFRMRRAAIKMFGSTADGVNGAADWLLSDKSLLMAAASAQIAETVAAVVTAAEPPVNSNTTPPPLRTPDIAHAFDGVNGHTAKQLSDWLSYPKKHQWVIPARAEQVTAPTPATWWPLEFAELLLARGAVYESLNSAFLNEPKLKPWLPLWQENRRERNALGL